jgi:hypothetical protein
MPINLTLKLKMLVTHMIIKSVMQKMPYQKIVDEIKGKIFCIHHEGK